ncbi:ATP-binding protein [Actinomadura hallensis]|uniref:ATP-binding protein n=1 Tax=Actinomadura hallensis TaxID=337895 RepID=UPI001639D09D|nr:ATP-binding protein [Actinomadura hallensis]HLV73382.1 ATP-binding protein [Vulgatibacteraceae bacterium]
MDHRQRLHFVLALEPVDEAVRTARDTVRAALEGWDREDVDGDLELIASELVTNAIRHANSVRLVVYLPDEKTAMVEVWDDNPQGPTAPVPDLHAEGGRGLMLVGALSCSWGWRATADGKVTWARTEAP